MGARFNEEGKNATFQKAPEHVPLSTPEEREQLTRPTRESAARVIEQVQEDIRRRNSRG